MKVSIVTISYNQAEFLNQTILSVLNQDYPDIEYIVVDPGSSDGSREIIESFGDRIIKVFENDNGPADGLNKGFKYASGDIYCYLNSDDVFLPGTIKSVVTHMTNNPSTDIVTGHGNVINGDSEFIRYLYSDRFSLRSAAYGAVTVIQPSTFFRSKMFDKVDGFNITNKSNWDGELLIDMALAGANIAIINKQLSCYRVHGKSITGSGRLALMHREYSMKMFQKIMRRPYLRRDRIFSYLYRFRKHILNPRATLERIFHGSVFGSE